MKRVDYCIYFVFALLGPHFANAEWVCVEDSKEIPGAPDSVQIMGELDTLTNCTYESFTVGEKGHYFEVRAGYSYNGVDIQVGVATKPASAGVTAPLEGFFYNGDLFDGNGKTLQEHFGDKVRPARNDEMGTVGVFVEKNKEGGMTLYLLHNGVPLGPALSISKTYSSLYPAVTVNGEATIQYVPKEVTELPSKLERSGNIISNFFKVISIEENTRTLQCSDGHIRLSPVGDHELNTKYNDGSEMFSFYVSFIEEGAENEVGILAKNIHREEQQWDWTDQEREHNDALRSECLKIVKSVFAKCNSFTLEDSKITASSSEGKSFVAEKSEFPTVTQNDFENSD